MALGSPTVLINGAPAARQGDTIDESGPPNTIVSGDPTVLIGSGSASADPSREASLYERLASYVGEYNLAIEGTDLGALEGRLSNETIDLSVTTDDGDTVFSFRMDGNDRIKGFRRGSRGDATVRMATDTATVDRLTGSETPATEFRQAVIDGDVVIRGVGPVRRIRWRTFDVLTDLTGSLGFR